jgi:hypothetical protein
LEIYLIFYFILIYRNVLYRIRNPLAGEEVAQSLIEFLILDEDGPALAIQLVIHDRLDLISLSGGLDLVQGRLLDHV